MASKLQLIFLAVWVSSALSGPVEEGADPGDEIIDPEDGFQGATTPAPLAFLEEWDEWQTWEAPEKIRKMAPYYKSGYDHDGLPVIVTHFGEWNYRELAQLKPEEVDDFLRYYEQYIRRIQTEGAANNHAGIALICDWDGFSLGEYASSHALKLALNTLTSITRANDVVQYVYAINTNFAAETFTNMARPFLGTVLEKFEMYGGRCEKWKPALLRKIPSSQLAPEYGGGKDWKPVPWNKEKLDK